MNQFKSGIILRDSVKLCEGANDSHSDLLEELGIRDDYLGASKKFIRAELVPKDGSWWTSPRKCPQAWEFIVDQDIVPDWFDSKEGEKEFRESVCDWWDRHVIVDKVISELTSGYYRLKGCHVGDLLNAVQVYLYNSTVGVMQDDSAVKVMRDNSTVWDMQDDSTVKNMRDKSRVEVMRDKSTATFDESRG